MWSNIKWVPFGDSLTDISLVPSRKYAQVIAESTDITVITSNAGKNMAMGGTGYLRKYNDGNSFYQRSLYVPADADIVTIFGSVNDWADDTGAIMPYCRVYDVSGDWGNLPEVNEAYKYTITEKAGVAGFIDTQYTLTGFINDTIRRIHRTAPNAKIVMIPGLYYLLSTKESSGFSTQKWMTNAYVLQKIIYDSWIASNVDGCRDWLYYESWYCLYNTSSKVTSYFNDTEHLDFSGVVSSNYGSTFDSRKFNPVYYGSDAFSYGYLRDWEENAYNFHHNVGVSCGHPSEAYYVNYLAPRFANLLCRVLDTSAAELPSNLRLNYGVAPSDNRIYTRYGNQFAPYDRNGDILHNAYDRYGNEIYHS